MLRVGVRPTSLQSQARGHHNNPLRSGGIALARSGNHQHRRERPGRKANRMHGPLLLTSRPHLPLGARGGLTDPRCRGSRAGGHRTDKWRPLAIELLTEVIEANCDRGARVQKCEGGATQCCANTEHGHIARGALPGSIGGPGQDQLDEQRWDQGVAQGQRDLANGTDGVALSNKLLHRVGHDGDPAAMLNMLWRAPCAKSGVDVQQLAPGVPELSWPQPTGG